MKSLRWIHLGSILDRNFIGVIFVHVVTFKVLYFDWQVSFSNGSDKNTDWDARHELVSLIPRLNAHEDELDFLIDWNTLRPQAAWNDLFKLMPRRIYGRKLAESSILIRSRHFLLTLWLVWSWEFELVWEAAKWKILDLKRTLLQSQLCHKIQFNLKLVPFELWITALSINDVCEIDQSFTARSWNRS